MRGRILAAIAALAVILPFHLAYAQDSNPPATDSPGISPPVPMTDYYEARGHYPLESLLNEDQGDVQLRYTVEKDGSVDNVVVTQTSHHPRLDNVSIKQVEGWRFHPATKDGEPIAVTQTGTVTWRLSHTELPEPGPVQFFMSRNDFPAGAWERKEEGIVQVLLSFDRNGKIVAYCPETTSGYADLDEAAKYYLTKNSHVTLPTIEGRPVAGQIEVLVVWSLTPHKDIPWGAEWGSPR